MIDKNLRTFLEPTFYIDSDHREIIRYTNENSRQNDPPEKRIIDLYYIIRDQFKYNPYTIDLRKEAMKASFLLTKEAAYCIEKANLLAACARVLRIPSRLGFANVKNHIGTDKLQKVLRSDILVFHGYADLFINMKWVKATPAFNMELCEKLGVEPLEFNGKEDSVFQEFDKGGGLYMQYVHDYGQFPDLPRDLFIAELRRHYGHLFDEPGITSIFPKN